MTSIVRFHHLYKFHVLKIWLQLYNLTQWDKYGLLLIMSLHYISNLFSLWFQWSPSFIFIFYQWDFFIFWWRGDVGIKCFSLQSISISFWGNCAKLYCSDFCDSYCVNLMFSISVWTGVAATNGRWRYMNVFVHWRMSRRNLEHI